ncbi:hypothetical protein SDC9_189801 [bioreactor metagenome]|uniref:Uncharacterized protein n=1 Tax=bioreactor metagenome TaxID=1076179 RepID=A0A645HT60_9ZZZZ
MQWFVIVTHDTEIIARPLGYNVIGADRKDVGLQEVQKAHGMHGRFGQIPFGHQPCPTMQDRF